MKKISSRSIVDGTRNVGAGLAAIGIPTWWVGDAIHSGVIEGLGADLTGLGAVTLLTGYALGKILDANSSGNKKLSPTN